MSEPAQYPLRLPRDLYAEVQKAADEQGGSVNTFIVAVLAGAVGYREPRQHMAAVSKWGSEPHVEQIAERLGLFERWHLEHELRMAQTPTETRLKRLLREGLVEIDHPAKSNIAAIYRWVGPKK